MNPASINIIGLVISTIAAALMYYVPPRGVTQYTDAGAPHATWTAAPTSNGKAIARRQKLLSRVSPILLAAGFALQLFAALLQK